MGDSEPTVRKKDNKDGKCTQVTSIALESRLHDDLKRMKKIRLHRGLRHAGFKVPHMNVSYSDHKVSLIVNVATPSGKSPD
ncbi:unnamed protein product [Bursaphelenchus xylophilus]|uniref:(pine wood nematode) hypothetical protein n=1 Tax=Bursaphelenchus xylophilus TaxID=6326 RepID=A0A1I7SIQ4_BURXY|nr:unnamed protein product [Bursaphelenchus xylophilus]CAG9114239.1 unnamed protein product [Bursaphelenchus xylophilus]